MLAEELVAQTRTSHYFVRSDGIVVQAVVSEVKQTLDDAQSNTRTFQRITGGQPRLLLVDMRVAYALEPKAREFYASPDASRGVRACALVTPSTPSRILGNMFLALNKPGYPCRMFSSVEDAVEWLRVHG